MSTDHIAGASSPEANQPEADQKASAAGSEQADGRGFRRSVGLLSAAAINMTQMVGIGPFITIPLMVAIFAGPQAIVGWVAGALLAVCDGLVWAELGAAMPGAGGTYLYLREAFQYRTGKLMPFLFIWTIVLAIPLIMSTGIIGLEQYLSYFLPNLSYWPMHLIGVGVTAVIVILLYRKIESIKPITIGLWIVMLVAVGMTIAASYTNFHPSLAFHYPHGAFGGGFAAALGAGLLIAIYDYLGYNTVSYMGGELRNPGKVMPRAIIISIFAIMAIYLAMNIGVLGVLPWQKVAHASSVASLAVTHNWGRPAADAVTVLILVTAMASVFAGLLGGSRVPYHAAREGLFFTVFGRMHAKHGFPYVSLLVMGLITAVGSFFSLTTIINVLLAVIIWVQAVAQIVALTVLRRRQPGLRRPYKQWLYPLPSLAALAGWLYVYASATVTALVWSTVWLAAGVVTYLGWARYHHDWPFGAKQVHEAFLQSQREHPDQDAWPDVA
jgi:amino acid transporter